MCACAHYEKSRGLSPSEPRPRAVAPCKSQGASGYLEKLALVALGLLIASNNSVWIVVHALALAFFLYT